MVEIPAAALTAARLAPHVDFFSIGTNDLTQYTMAAERGDARLAALLDGPQPAVLRLDDETVRAANAHDGWVGVCGELAGDPAAAVLLAGLGVTELSMAPGLIAGGQAGVALGLARATRARRPCRRSDADSATAARGLGTSSVVGARQRVAALTNVRGMEAGSLNALRSSRALAVGTGLRIAACPVIMALVLSRDDTIAAIVFLVAAATDWFDGRLARRWGVTTTLGSFLDTTADKLLVTTTLIALVAVHRVVTVGHAGDRRPGVHDPRPACRGRRRRRPGDGDLDARQVEGDRPVRRDRARDPAPGGDDRRRLSGSVGDGDRRRRHRLVGCRLPGAVDRRAALLMARAFVTGGTGVIGTALVTALLATRRRGHRAGP